MNAGKQMDGEKYGAPVNGVSELGMFRMPGRNPHGKILYEPLKF